MAENAVTGFQKHKEKDNWYLSGGIGYHTITEGDNELFLGETQTIRINSDIYPIFRFGWILTDQLSVEGALRYELYSCEYEGTFIGKGSEETGISIVAGPVYRLGELMVPFLGKFRPFANAGIGYRKLNMGIDFPVKDIDSSFGYEVAGGFTNGPIELRAGISNYSYAKDNYESSDFSTSLNQSGIFIELSYIFSFRSKKETKAEAVAQNVVIKKTKPEEDIEDMKSSEEMIQFLGTVDKTISTIDETANVSKKMYLKVEFDFDSDVIKSISYPVLNELGLALLKLDVNSDTLLIYGYPDSDGPSTYNQLLSERRAKSVKKYIIDHFQLNHLKIDTKGFAKSRPSFPDVSTYNKIKNRSIEIIMRYDSYVEFKY